MARRAFFLVSGIFLVSLADAALAEGTATPSAKPLLDQIVDKALGPGVTLAILSLFAWPFLKYYEEKAKLWQMQRDLAKATTAQVTDLAKTHYWALSNQAGTLSDLLNAYLVSVEKHLFVTYTVPNQTADASEQIRLRMREVSKETAENSLGHLARLMIAFRDFQDRGSNTYLLPNHASGEALRRLYNQFASCIPGDGTFRDGLQRYGEILSRSARPVAADEDADAAPPDPAFDKDALMEVWERWLAFSLPQVSEAAEALEAYASLMAVELAYLNGPFFRDHKTGARAFLQDDFEVLSENLLENSSRRFGRAEWPGLLDGDVLKTILRSKHHSRAFRPASTMTEVFSKEKKEEQSPETERGKGDDYKKGTRYSDA